MFRLTKQQLGHWPLICLENERTGNSLSLVPAQGACLTSLQLDGMEILHGYQSSKELDQLNGAKSGLLFPFPNRLSKGQYQWESKDYQFPINEPQRGNAIHGLGLKMPFQIQQVYLFPDHAGIVLATDHPGNSAFPFPFRKEIRYELVGDNLFKIRWKLINRGSSSMPFAWGWHPYFQLGGKVNDWNLRLPESKQVLVDDQMIPTGAYTDFGKFKDLEKVGDKVFDTCFVLSGKDRSVIVEGPAGKLRITMGRLHSYLQVFTPPSRKSIAIEPMTANINSFQNGEGLLSVPRGSYLEDQCEVVFEKKNPLLTLV